MPGGLRCVVLYFKFYWNRSSGFAAVGGRKSPFPIALAIGLYNSLYYRTSRDRGHKWLDWGHVWLGHKWQHRGPQKTCHLLFVHNFDKYWPIFKILSLLDSAVNLLQDTCRISHHTYNMSLHYLVKNNTNNSKILTNLTQYRHFALLSRSSR